MNAAEAKRERVQNPPKSAEQLRRETELQTLELNRLRIAHDLEASSNPRHREMLQASLKYLDEKIADLNNVG